MRVKFNERTQKIGFEIEDADRINYHKIKETFNTEGWKVICDVHAVAREEIIRSLKKCARTRAKRDLCGSMASMIDGLDQFRDSVAEFVARIEVAIDQERGRPEDNGSFNGEDD